MRVHRFRHGNTGTEKDSRHPDGNQGSGAFHLPGGNRSSPVRAATDAYDPGFGLSPPSVRRGARRSQKPTVSVPVVPVQPSRNRVAGSMLRSRTGWAQFVIFDGDKHMLLVMGLLLLVGLATLWSGSSGYGLNSRYKNTDYFVIRQVLFAVFGFLLFLGTAWIPFALIRKYIGMAMIGTFLLMCVPVITNLGVSLNGAQRWIGFGNSTFQPSELWKPVLVVYVAHLLDKNKDRLSNITAALLPPILIIVLGSLVIYLQSNASTAILAAIAGVIVLWASGTSFMFLLQSITILIPLGILSIMLSEYRMKRIASFIAPDQDLLGKGYQLNASIKAIASGGLFGKGLGLGTRKIASIPTVQSDFIFASFAEEWGFVGVVAVFLLWGYLFWRSFRISFKSDGFTSSLAFGLTCILVIQVIANLAVVSGFFPTTGLPLPLFSQGGSSILATGIEFGLLYNCSRQGVQS